MTHLWSRVGGLSRWHRTCSQDEYLDEFDSTLPMYPPSPCFHVRPTSVHAKGSFRLPSKVCNGVSLILVRQEGSLAHWWHLVLLGSFSQEDWSLDSWRDPQGSVLAPFCSLVLHPLVVINLLTIPTSTGFVQPSPLPVSIFTHPTSQRYSPAHLPDLS